MLVQLAPPSFNISACSSNSTTPTPATLRGTTNIPENVTEVTRAIAPIKESILPANSAHPPNLRISARRSTTPAFTTQRTSNMPENVRKATRANAPINDCTPHMFNVCSDLPNLGRLGIFSCDACDRWRTKDITGRRIFKPRSEMKSFFCTRELKGMGPIRIRVVCGVTNKADEKRTPPDNHNNNVEKLRRGPKWKALTPALLSPPVSVECTVMSKIAKEVDERLKLEKEVSYLQGELEAQNKKFLAFHKKMQPFTVRPGDTSDGYKQFKEGIERLASNIFANKHSKTKAAALKDVMEHYSLFNGESAASLKHNSINYIQQLFRPWKLVKAGDISPVGAFKTSTIDALHKVIDESDEGLFPGLKAVSKARKLLDEEAVRLIGYECKKTIHGEVFFVDFNKSLRLLLKACQLHDIAINDSVSIAFTIDGADLIRDRTHVSTGVKVTDIRGVHPTTKQPLFQRTNDDEERYVRVQSFELCSLMMIADAKDSKSLYEDVFKEFYEWGKHISIHGLPAADGEPALMPFNVTHNSDMKAAWYLTNKGGGCKTKHFFCTLCSCTRNQLVSFNIDESQCARCKRRNKQKCFHHDVCDSVKVEELLQELEADLGDYYNKCGKHFEEV
jgi:hypothetical protein